MNPKNASTSVCVLGRHADVMQRVLNMLSNNGYLPFGTLIDEEAYLYCVQNKISVLVIGGGVSEADEINLKLKFEGISFQIQMLRAHPSTILKELEELFEQA
jgi:hypothetical protein